MHLRMTISLPAGRSYADVLPDSSHDYESLVMEACQALGEADCQFHVGGFGQDYWPVDIAYDLSSAIEQLPGAVQALQRDKQAVIDFYGQGIERCLTLTPSHAAITVQCSSRTAGNRHPRWSRHLGRKSCLCSRRWLVNSSCRWSARV